MSKADGNVETRMLISKPFAGSDQWLFSIKNTKQGHGPERNVWPKNVIVAGQEIKANVTCYWTYNGSLQYGQLVDDFGKLPNLKRANWVTKGMGILPLDTIYLKKEIGEHLMSDTAAIDEDHPEHFFGARYQFASVREFFEDEEVATTLDDQQDSQDAIDSLA